MRMSSIAAVPIAALVLAAGATAQERYRMPPREVVDILDALPLPAVSLDPERRHMLLIDRESLPPVADLAAPMLRLAGSRINPAANAPRIAPAPSPATRCARWRPARNGASSFHRRRM